MSNKKLIGLLLGASMLLSAIVPAFAAVTTDKTTEYNYGDSITINREDSKDAEFIIKNSAGAIVLNDAMTGGRKSFTFKIPADASLGWTEGEYTVTVGDETTKFTLKKAAEEPGKPTEKPAVTPKPVEKPETGGSDKVSGFKGDTTIALKDLINTKKLDSTLSDGAALQNWLYIDIKGTYGKDYAATYKGKELSEAAYNDLIAGVTEDDVKLVIKDLVFNVKYGQVVNAAPVYQKGEEAPLAYLNLGGSKTVAAPPTATPTNKPSGSGSGSGSSGGHIARPGNTVTGGTGVTGGSAATSKFQDLGSVAWAETQINTLASLGILNGYSETEFGPNGIVTRAEFTKMVCSALTIAPDTSAAQRFADVAPSDWYYGYVMAAANAGVVNGVSDSAFDPNRTITRQEMAVILYRAINATKMTIPSGTAKTFADAAAIADYAVPAVNALSAAGVIDGVSATTFAPAESATRAQAACILYKYYQSVGAL